MKKKCNKTLALIFKRPVSGNVKWADIDKGAVASIRKWLEANGVKP